MKKPWQKINSKQIHKNSYWQAFEDRVIRPDGTKGKYYHIKVNHFVSVIVLSDDNKSAYLTRQWRYLTNGNSWETCQGGIEKNETPRQAAKRELAEEMGFTAKSFKKIGFSYGLNGLSNQGFHVFIAKNLSVVPRSLEGSEADMIVKKFSLKKIIKMIESGAIKDAPTIVSFYYLKLKADKKL